MTLDTLTEFRDSGLLWFANRMLHPFGWRLVSFGPPGPSPHSVLIPERFAHVDPPMSDDALHRAALLQYLRVRTPRVTDPAALDTADQARLERVLGYTADPE